MLFFPKFAAILPKGYLIIKNNILLDKYMPLVLF